MKYDSDTAPLLLSATILANSWADLEDQLSQMQQLVSSAKLSARARNERGGYMYEIVTPTLNCD